jgi:hypothetical protein
LPPSAPDTVGDDDTPAPSLHSPSMARHTIDRSGRSN